MNLLSLKERETQVHLVDLLLLLPHLLLLANPLHQLLLQLEVVLRLRDRGLFA